MGGKFVSPAGLQGQHWFLFPLSWTLLFPLVPINNLSLHVFLSQVLEGSGQKFLCTLRNHHLALPQEAAVSGGQELLWKELREDVCCEVLAWGSL